MLLRWWVVVGGSRRIVVVWLLLLSRRHGLLHHVWWSKMLHMRHGSWLMVLWRRIVGVWVWVAAGRWRRWASTRLWTVWEHVEGRVHRWLRRGCFLCDGLGEREALTGVGWLQVVLVLLLVVGISRRVTVLDILLWRICGWEVRHVRILCHRLLLLRLVLVLLLCGGRRWRRSRRSGLRVLGGADGAGVGGDVTQRRQIQL